MKTLLSCIFSILLILSSFNIAAKKESHIGKEITSTLFCSLYDHNGNILTDGLEGVAMEYDINNMVRRVKTSLGDTLATYLYFADGEKYGVTTAPRYLYNGKEKQEFIHNTGSVLNAAGSATYTSNYIDYGARFYNPVTLRWTTQDPLAEKYMGYSPYNYCVNSPIILIGFNGNAFLIDLNNDRVTFFDEQEALIEIKYDDFKRMGNQEQIK